jgi:hypothetical protein
MLESVGISFWEFHGFWFIFFMFLFPRLTMLFTGICFMPFTGVLFWFGWVLAPRLTVAILATFFYFQTNPVLCVFTWLWALGGESTEKKACSRCGNSD